MMIGCDKITTDTVIIKLKVEWRILKEVLTNSHEEKTVIGDNGITITNSIEPEKLKMQQIKIDLLMDILTEIK